jgi:TRAP-type mannitol/chloroaromatic compound transport system permease small subunit
MTPRLVRAERLFNRFSDAIGTFSAVLLLLLILNVFFDVVMRYLFNDVSIGMQELEWHLFAMVFLFGVAYTLKADGHVRVDVVAEKFRPKTRAWIELIGLVCIVFPLVYIIVINAWPFVTRSYAINEVSAAPGGLTHRWIIKSVIIAAFVYLGLAALSRLLRVTAYLFGVPRPIRH